jgi:catechol 2,3-dioxygenase-like lactoylglutathione lyase family enzyme
MTRFHLSLNVADLAKSVAFYKALFGIEPAKLRSDYAKFEPDDPPLVLSLEPTPRPTGGPLNHLGFRYSDEKTLVATQARLEAAGLRSQREDGVECCYAKQTKFWLHDPDGTLWEFYTLDGDLDHRGMGQTEEVVLGTSRTLSIEPIVYEHRMNSPVPDAIPMEAATADEVRLRGTFNLPIGADERAAVLKESLRVLKPGGRLFVHVLTGERPVDSPDLPGPASVVRHVPETKEIVGSIESAGLVKLKMLKFGEKPCFVRNDVAMRETQIEAFKP